MIRIFLVQISQQLLDETQRQVFADMVSDIIAQTTAEQQHLARQAGAIVDDSV